MRQGHALPFAGFCLLLLPAAVWGQKRVMPTAADAGLPPYIQLDTVEQTMTASFRSPFGIDAASVKFIINGVDRTRDAKHDDKTISCHVSEQSIMAGSSVRLELKDKRGCRAVAQVSPTSFISGESNTVVSYFLPRREKTRVLICDYGTETPERTIMGWHGPGEVAVPWNGKDDAGQETGAGIYMFYVEARRGKRWVRIAAIDPLDDTARLKREAASEFYIALPQAVRKRAGRDEFLFLSFNKNNWHQPSGEYEGDSGGGETGRLVCASRDSQGNIAILWQYDLPDDALDAIWWDHAPGQAKDAIIVQLQLGFYLTLSAPQDKPPTLWNAAGTMPRLQGLDLVQSLWVRPDPSKPALLLSIDEGNSVYLLDLTNGLVQTLWSCPQVTAPDGDVQEQGYSKFIAAGDLNGDGGLEIAAFTARLKHIKDTQNYLTLDPILRVWRYKGGRFQEVYSSPFREGRAIDGQRVSISKDREPVIAVRLYSPPESMTSTLALFQWNGAAFRQVSSAQSALSSLNVDTDEFTVADLDGDGVDEFLMLAFDLKRNLHLVVLKPMAGGLSKIWQSPPLDVDKHIRFGRVDEYDHQGRDELPLLNASDPLQGKAMSLFRQSGRRYVGWEVFKKPPPPLKPPPPPPPTAEDRLWSFAYDEGHGSEDPFLTLDEKKIIQIHPTNDMINALWRGKQDRKRLLLLAKQRFPPSRVMLRHRGNLWKVMANNIAVEILMPADAINAKKPLPALAQDWLKAVQTILRGLEAPAPKRMNP